MLAEIWAGAARVNLNIVNVHFLAAGIKSGIDIHARPQRVVFERQIENQMEILIERRMVGYRVNGIKPIIPTLSLARKIGLSI